MIESRWRKCERLTGVWCYKCKQDLDLTDDNVKRNLEFLKGTRKKNQEGSYTKLGYEFIDSIYPLRDKVNSRNFVNTTLNIWVA